jgi:hypothetical protein
VKHLHRAGDLLVRVRLDEVVQLLLQPGNDVTHVRAGCRVVGVQVHDGLLQVLVLDLSLFIEVVT